MKILKDVDMSGNKVTSLAEPSANSDAATKSYVDGKTTVQSVNTKTGAVVLAASDIAITDNSNNFTTDTVQGAIDQLFQSANDGKTNIASAIGSPATSSDTFSQLSTHITTGKQQIATAINDGVVNSSSTFQQLASAISAAGTPNFGVSKNVEFDETIDAGKIVESYYRSMQLSTQSITISGVQPEGNVNVVDWSQSGIYLAVGSGLSPRLTIYKKNGNTLTNLGIGATWASNLNGLSFSSDDTYLAGVSEGVTPRLRIFKRSGDTFTQLASTGYTDITSLGQTCKFSPDSNFLAVGQSLSVGTSLFVYSRSGDTFTRLTIADQPATIVNSVSWSPDSNYLAVGIGGTTTSYLMIYRREGNNFIKLSNASVLSEEITNSIKSVAYSPNGNYLAVATINSPFIRLFKRTASEYYDLLPALTFGLPAGTAYGVSWSPNGAYLTVAHDGITVFHTTYKLKNDTLINQASPVQPTTRANACAWSPDANSLAVGCQTATTKVFVYNNDSTTYLFNNANTEAINPFDRIIGLSKQAGIAGQTKSVDVLVGRSLLP